MHPSHRRTLERFLREARDAKPKFDLNKICFPQQLKFIKDTARLKALFCTRRAAKSYTGGVYMCDVALKYPGSNILFIALTRDSAKGIMWKDILKELDYKYQLNLKFNETELTATFPNGSVIKLLGCDTDEAEMNKLLGKRIKLAVIDEASVFSINMHQLVYGILKPATADQRGSICLLGTSSNITRGLFYDITTHIEPGWSLHTWTAHDNPHVAIQWAEELEDIAKSRPLFMETALFKQWYLNQWVIDEDARCYHFKPQLNRSSNLPAIEGTWSYVLGVDLGHSPDPSAFVVGAYSDESSILYFVHAEKHLRMDITDVANKIKELDFKYKFDVKVVDNANKQAVEELNIRHKVGLIAAEKAGKVDFINLMNTDFIQGKIKALPGTEGLQDEWSTLVWATDNGKIKEPRKEHPSLPNHLTDAALYLWRWCYNYIYEAPKQLVDYRSQSRWEGEHIDRLQKAVITEQNPNQLDFPVDDNLFDFSLDDQI